MVAKYFKESPVTLSTEQDYFDYYIANFVKGPPICTPDKMRITFYEERFKHAFFLTDRKTMKKTGNFARDRAERMNLIKEVIESPISVSRKRFDPKVRVWRRIIIDTVRKFAVICQPESGNPQKARFITAYSPDQETLNKMLANDKW